MTVRQITKTPGHENVRLMLPCLLSAVLAIYAAYLLLPPVADNALIRLPSQVHDFGPLMPLSKAECTFTGTNTLTEPLFIDRIVKSCGCTTAQCDCSLVQPGQKFLLKAIL